MSTSVTRAEFLEAFRARPGERGEAHIDPDAALEADTPTLARAGATGPVLERLAGADGVIAGDRELNRLFDLLDDSDQNGSRHSFVTSRPAAPGPVSAVGNRLPEPTAAGAALDTLLNARRATRRSERAGFVDKHDAGYLDLERLDAAAADRLAGCGLAVSEIRALADDRRRIRGATALIALFGLLDRLDKNGSAASFDRAAALPLEAPLVDQDLTPAGEAEAILSALFVPYAQPFTFYDDLDRALEPADPPPTSIALDVPPIVQWDSTSCYRACRRMIATFDANADRQINDGAHNHYMARAENRAGALTGAGEDFARGRAYVDHCLEQGRPVMIGLSHADRAYNFDRITDHFVVIKGRGVDAEGRLFYAFADPATSGANRESRFYVDRDSAMLFRPATDSPARIVAQRSYQVSLVVTYRTEGFDFEEVTGEPPTSYR